jgi:hypothetical protein
VIHSRHDSGLCSGITLADVERLFFGESLAGLWHF